MRGEEDQNVLGCLVDGTLDDAPFVETTVLDEQFSGSKVRWTLSKLKQKGVSLVLLREPLNPHVAERTTFGMGRIGEKVLGCRIHVTQCVLERDFSLAANGQPTLRV